MILKGKGWDYIAVKKLPALLRGLTSEHYSNFCCLNCFHCSPTKNLNLIKKFVQRKIFVIFWCLLKPLKRHNFMVPFYGWGSTASRLEPLRGGSLLFTTKFPEIPGTHFIDLERMNGWVDLGATQWFWTRDPWIENPAP